jgi:hypothetical protein
MFLHHPVRAAGAVAAAVIAVIATGLVACSASAPTGSTKPLNLPYAVLYGVVTTANNSTAVLVSGEAYLDSASALARRSPFGGFNAIGVNAAGAYATMVFSQVPRKVFFDLIAVSARPSAADTDFAIPVQLDSIGGTPPHDSLELNFRLP